MSFFEKIRMALARFMQGRYGADQLSLLMLVLSLVLNIFSSIFVRVRVLSTVFSIAAAALLILCLLRIFSRNTVARGAENRKYLNLVYPLRNKIRQWRTRFANRKIYSYFHCPKCRCSMRLPKTVHGTVKITCKSCGYVFEKKL